MIPTMAETLQFLGLRKKSYQSLFGPSGIVGSEGLKDLAKFCRAFDTCIVRGDRDQTHVLEGRREVWLHIQQYLHLSEEELVALYKAVIAGE